MNLCYNCLEYDMEHNLCKLSGEESGEATVSCYTKIPFDTKDYSALTCLLALRTVYNYLEDEEAGGGETYWIDKKWYGFKADMGYLYEGLLAMEEYLIDRLRTPESKENANERTD